MTLVNELNNKFGKVITAPLLIPAAVLGDKEFLKHKNDLNLFLKSIDGLKKLGVEDIHGSIDKRTKDLKVLVDYKGTTSNLDKIHQLIVGSLETK